MTRDSVGGRQAVIGRGRRQTFVLAAVFEGRTARPDKLDRFLDESSQYARTMKRGLLSATALAVAVAESGDGAGGWSGSPSSGGAVAYPVLVDLARRSVSCAVGDAHLRRVVADYVAPAAGAAFGG